MKKKKSGGLGGLYIMIAVCLVCSAVAVFGLMGKLQGYQESNDSYANLQQAALSIRTDDAAPMPAAVQSSGTGSAANAPAAAAQNNTQSSAQQPGDAQQGSPSALTTISPQELAAAKAAAEAEEANGGYDAVPVYDPSGMTGQAVSSGPEEEEDVLDEALVWMLKNQTEDELITDRPGSLFTPAPTEYTVQAAQPTAAPAATASSGEATATANNGSEPNTTTGDPAAATANSGSDSNTIIGDPAPAAANNGSEPDTTTGDPAPATANSGSDSTTTTGEPNPTTPTDPSYLVAASTGSKTASGEKQLSGKADNLQLTPKPTATPTPSPTLDATTATPAPTHTPPPYVPSSGISMERAVTVPSAKLAVNFDYLTLVNDEVVGWIYQEDSPINYPVVRGKNNSYYLTRLFDHTVNDAGSVFMDAGNSAAFIDSATYLYGHHSKGGGMFASLSDYLDPAYYETHPQFLLLTPFADYQVDVFAGMATIVEDETSWRPKTLESEQDLNEFLELILPQSFIHAPEDKLPLWGDRMLVLVTCTNIKSNQRYVIYGRMRPIVYESTEEAVVTTKAAMDAKESVSGYKDIEGMGRYMYYAQNDPLWERMRYESRGSGKYRVFGDGGCGPTAVATAIANLCPVEELPRLIGYANTELGYTFCDCSVNRFYCNHTHAQYQLRTGEEFLRYMPLAVANFATGNNIWDIKSRRETQGTNMRFLDKICAIYGIRVTVIEEAEELIERLREEKVDGIKRMAISCAIKGSPFTKSGHFLVIAGVDDEYMYFLDPLQRDNYDAYDRFDYAEILTPGVCRIRLENTDNCNLIPFYLLEKVQ